MRIKGLRVRRLFLGFFEVTPLYHAKGGATRAAPALAETGEGLPGVLAKVLQRLVARGDLAL